MTVDLRTGVHRAPDPQDYCTKITAVGANKRGCKLWLSFLDRVTAGDKELQAYLQRVAGYCCTGSTREEALFFLYGTGANGKGVFLKTLRAIWHDYAVAAPMETFTESRTERHPTELAHLRGARLVIAQETEQGRRWSETKIKALTGGDPIPARYMRGNFFEFTPQFKLMIAGNHKPSLRSVDEAIRRRFHLIPFAVTIPVGERDHDLFEKLKPEWGGILQWGIDGCLEWQRNGLAPPKAVIDATEHYLHEEDSVARWLDECTVIDVNKFAAGIDLWDSWRHWCASNNEREGSRKNFTQMLVQHGIKDDRGYINKKQVRGHHGLRLTEYEEKRLDLDRNRSR